MISCRLTVRFNLVLTALLLGGATAQAGARPHYVVGVENIAYLPAYDGTGKEYSGFARQILDRYAQDAGLTFVYRPLPIPRLVASLTSGAVDFKFPDNPNWDRTKKQGVTILYSDPVCRYVDGTVVTAAAKGQDITQIKTIGMVTGFTAWSWIDQINNGTVTIKENGSFEALLRQAAARRVDGVYASIANVTYALDHDTTVPVALVFDPALPHDDSHYFFSTIKYPDVIANFNLWMKNNAGIVAKLKKDSGVEDGLP